MKITAASNPFHISRAYGLAQPASVPRVPVEAPRVDRNDAAQAKLVAGVVPGRVDFSGEAPRPSDTAAIPMYRHPADRNAAATAVNAGRRIDVRG